MPSIDPMVTEWDQNNTKKQKKRANLMLHAMSSEFEFFFSIPKLSVHFC